MGKMGKMGKMARKIESQLYERVYASDGSSGVKLNLHPGQQRAWDSTRRIVAILAIS